MYATPDDVSKCTQIVMKQLTAKGITLDNDSINHIVQRILALIYATGGSYSNESLEDYTKIYLKDNLS